MIEGAILVLIGLAVGRLLPGRRVPQSPKPSKPPDARCGCSHHLSKHDPETGSCKAELEGKFGGKIFKDGEFIGYARVFCECMHYVGPVPADMMLRTWNPKGL